MLNKISNKNIKFIFLLLISAELLSFLGYYYHTINALAFFAVTILALTLSLRRLNYGLYILLAELFIGSFGYLFYFESGGLKISLRVALWLIVMSVWLGRTILSSFKAKRLEVAFLKSRYFNYFFVLFIFIGWALINGFLNNNSFANIFQDFDRWLFLLLIFPIFSALPDENNLSAVKQIFLASASWLSVKTLLLAYFFSHNFAYFTLDLYRWVRLSGAGEITQIAPGFSRVFMQSQIFVLIGFFLILYRCIVIPALSRNPGLGARNKFLDCGSAPAMTINFLLLTLYLSAIIISFSRSFWIGLAAGALTVWLVMIFKLRIRLKQFLIFNGLVILIVGASLALTAAAVKFPYPSPSGGFDAANLVESRATSVANEAGAASRWRLLPPLWQKIKTAPLMGQGFGATVTYYSSDPRILASSPGGLYTTYAFEWGWLDVWLKLGLFGLLAYLALFAKLIHGAIISSSYFSLSLACGLIILAAVNIFSPYINHPLGIGYLLLATIFMERLNNFQFSSTNFQ